MPKSCLTLGGTRAAVFFQVLWEEGRVGFSTSCLFGPLNDHFFFPDLVVFLYAVWADVFEIWFAFPLPALGNSANT